MPTRNLRLQSGRVLRLLPPPRILGRSPRPNAQTSSRVPRSLSLRFPPLHLLLLTQRRRVFLLLPPPGIDSPIVAQPQTPATPPRTVGRALRRLISLLPL
jgi:hypothetical protein